MALATLQSVVAIGVGLLLYNTVSGLLGRQPPLPQPLEHAFPHLRERVAFFIGPGLHVLRAAIAVAIAVTLLDAWALFDLDAWLRSEGSRTLFASVASVAFIVLMAALVWVAFASWVDRRLGTEGGAGSRERTLLSLFRNAAAIVIIVMTTMIALSEIGIEIGPLLAGAGVIGLAVGFGAQSLVQDIITGVFIQLENAVNRDDVITVGGITGVVERLSVRSVGLRDLAGTFHIVPFSQVGTVSNYMRGYAFHLGEYDIAYREDPDEALECLKAAFAELREDPELGGSVLDDLEIHGVTALSDSSVKIRVRVKTEAGMQWSVGRAYNRLVKRHLDAAGIEIPFPHMTLYFGQDKEGSAAPANLRFVEGSGDRRELPAADATAA
jgi:small conductance mechanosensitive channel